MTAVHQLIPSIADRDAISAHTWRLRDVLRSCGYDSEIFAGQATGTRTGEVRDMREFRGVGRHDAVVYQLSIGSPIADRFLEVDANRIVNYHNITPAAFYWPWDPPIAFELEFGRRQMRTTAAGVAHGVGVSAFNAAELRGAGCADARSIPLLYEPLAASRGHDDALAQDLAREKSKGGSDLLFVGRLSPNKCQHDVIKAFAAFRRAYDPDARLHLVGAPASETYFEALRRYVAVLGLGSCVRMYGSIPNAELVSLYRSADVLLCLSQHEGFCLPLVEAMQFDVPIVALKAAAVPETIADAGLLLPTQDAEIVATALLRMLRDEDLRSRCVAAGRVRREAFALSRTQACFATYFDEVVGRA